MSSASGFNSPIQANTLIISSAPLTVRTTVEPEQKGRCSD
jgi:hypothetical protein